MKQLTSQPDDFAAFVGLDWADAKHDVCLQAADTNRREACVLQHKPEAIEEWVSALRQRFQGKPIAIALELDKGPIVAALQKYDGLVLFPINPLTLARYREAFTTSCAKDDPTDAQLQLELLLKHRDKLNRLRPQSVVPVVLCCESYPRIDAVSGPGTCVYDGVMRQCDRMEYRRLNAPLPALGKRDPGWLPCGKHLGYLKTSS